MFSLAALQKEIKEKKRLIEQVTGEPVKGGKKVFRKEDFERLQFEQLQKAKSNKSLEPPELPPSSSVDNSHSSKPSGESEEKDQDAVITRRIPISSEEIIRRLRARQEPIRFFAESDWERYQRLKALEIIEERSEGQRNDFMKTLEVLEQEFDLEALSRSDGGRLNKSHKESLQGRETGEEKKQSSLKLEINQQPITLALLKTEKDKIFPLIYFYLKKLLREWEEELEKMPESQRRSTQGKLQLATQKQTAEYLKPFLKMLRRKDVEADVLARITEIIENLQQREYVKANDAYLRLSIGNAPWPIGVTMVGIHERSGREKIFSQQIAHVLNDETQRKWIQSVKRLMTFAQNRYPPDDITKLVG